MKSLNMLALGLAVFAGAPLASYAQEAPKTKLQAYVMMGKKASRLPIMNAAGKGQFTFMQEEQQMQMAVSKCDMFMFITPADYAAAMTDYRAGDLAGARKKFASIKGHYSEYIGLPGNPSTLAALAELDCAQRMLDWGATKSLADGFAHPDYLSAEDQARIAVAKVLGNITDAPGGLDAQKEAVAAILKSDAGKKLSVESYAWLRYALARAYEAQVPAEQLNGTVTAEQAPDLIKAVDNYCQAAVASHGTRMEIPVDAMQRAMRILWAQPGVKEYAAGSATMDAARWNAAPVNFKDAVALAQLLKTVYTADSGATLAQKALVDELVKYYYNPEKDKPAAAAAEEGAEG